MIIFVRHQHGNPQANCLSEKGIKESKCIADVFGNLKNVNIYTCYPRKQKHIRPLQTASIVCTYLNKNVNVVEEEETDLPQDCSKGNYIVIWHHSQIEHLVRMYCDLEAPLHWDKDDYYRAVLIDHHKVVNIPDFRQININY